MGISHRNLIRLAVFMASALKITLGILIIGVIILMKVKGRYRGTRRMIDFAFLGFAGLYLIVAGNSRLSCRDLIPLSLTGTTQQHSASEGGDLK